MKFGRIYLTLLGGFFITMGIYDFVQNDQVRNLIGIMFCSFLLGFIWWYNPNRSEKLVRRILGFMGIGFWGPATFELYTSENNWLHLVFLSLVYTSILALSILAITQSEGNWKRRVVFLKKHRYTFAVVLMIVALIHFGINAFYLKPSN